MVTSDDEMGSTKVLADDGVPDGFTRAGHAHSERQQSERGHALRVGADDSFVDADAGEGVNISRCVGEEVSAFKAVHGESGKTHAWSARNYESARLSDRLRITTTHEPNDRVDEYVRFLLARSADRQFAMSAVHGVAGLESYDTAPRQLVEVLTKLRRSVCRRESMSVWLKMAAGPLHAQRRAT